MPIPVWDYRGEYAVERETILEAVERVFRSGRLILGGEVRAFEQRFADYCGLRFGVGVNSGTDALFIALKVLGIGSGDEVITVANTAVPTVSAIVSTGATPRFVDIDPATHLMDADQLEHAITPRTTCVLPVHLFGQCVRMERVQAISRKHGLFVLEDCAQAHGATRHGTMAGAMSDVAAFSFYPTKILGGYGDGGMVVTNDEALAARARRLRMYGMERESFAEEHGYNSRLDELHAAILLTKLDRLDSYVERRRALAARYHEALAETSLVLPQTDDANLHAYYLFVVRHPKRDRIIDELAKRDIAVNVSYRWPIHLMPAYRWLGYREGDLVYTERVMQEVFSLPMYPSLSEEDQDRVCASLHEILQIIDDGR
ncbi:MAG: aminotransferase class V-fold PLP-dependent enzyme [Chloroflexi bacterium]|nr:aminotransferase class V-fold PLP-dependent enzyme [Chloroflexota bacterium]